MDINTIILIVVGVLVLFMLWRQQQQEKAPKGEGMVMLQEQVGKLSETVHNQLESHSERSTKVISDISEKVAKLEKTNEQAMSQVSGYSEQLVGLQKILTSQKRRGNLGEAGLKAVLENILPPDSFELQYSFPNGETVDAAIITKDGIIPVDAKFPMENYTRLLDETDPDKADQYERAFKNDLKARIDEVSKYISPEHGTLEFALMYIPSEAIFYDLLVNEVGAVKVNTRHLIDYAFIDKRVVIVSPTTFAAYLHTVLQGLRALKTEEDVKQIQQSLKLLQRHISAYNDYFRKLGKHLSATVGAFNKTYKELGKIDKDVKRIAGGERQTEPELLDRPVDAE